MAVYAKLGRITLAHIMRDTHTIWGDMYKFDDPPPPLLITVLGPHTTLCSFFGTFSSLRNDTRSRVSEKAVHGGTPQQEIPHKHCARLLFFDDGRWRGRRLL